MSLRSDLDELTQQVQELQERLEELEDGSDPKHDEPKPAIDLDYRPFYQAVERLERVESALQNAVTKATLPARIATMLRDYRAKAGDHGKLTAEGWEMLYGVIRGIADRLDLWS